MRMTEWIGFSSAICLRMTDGFRKYTSLCRVEIPSSVVMTNESAVSQCAPLNEVLFSSDGHLRDTGCSLSIRTNPLPSIKTLMFLDISKGVTHSTHSASRCLSPVSLANSQKVSQDYPRNGLCCRLSRRNLDPVPIFSTAFVHISSMVCLLSG
jgi:hypothetical protein